MSISSVPAITSVSYTPVYALSPYLIGIVRVSDAARDVADVAATLRTSPVAQTTNATTAPPAPTPAQLDVQAEIAARASATSAISTIAARSAITAAPQLPEPTTASLAPVPANGSDLSGDAGLLVQSYGAVALLYGPHAAVAIAASAARPAITPVAPPVPVAAVRPVDTFG